MNGLEQFFDTYLRQKAPFSLPAGVKEFIVKFGPWISLILLILGAVVIIPLALLALGLTAASLPFQAVGVAQISALGILRMLIGLAVLVMEAVAIPGLFKRKLSAWHLVYYAILLSALGDLLALNIISLIIGLVVGMYILFQIKEYYH